MRYFGSFWIGNPKLLSGSNIELFHKLLQFGFLSILSLYLAVQRFPHSCLICSILLVNVWNLLFASFSLSTCPLNSVSSCSFFAWETVVSIFIIPERKLSAFPGGGLHNWPNSSFRRRWLANFSWEGKECSQMLHHFSILLSSLNCFLFRLLWLTSEI